MLCWWVQHYLLAYRDALAAICRAQADRKKRLQVTFASFSSPLPLQLLLWDEIFLVMGMFWKAHLV